MLYFQPVSHRKRYQARYRLTKDMIIDKAAGDDGLSLMTAPGLLCRRGNL
jgi:hypothetical protein